MMSFNSHGQCRLTRSVRHRPLALLITVIVMILVSALEEPRFVSADSFGREPSLWENFFCIGSELCQTGDFNGDDKDDIIAFVRSIQTDGQLGDVAVALSDGSRFRLTNTIWQEFFCIDDEVCRVGDFNGDGRDDIITFVRSNQPTGQRGDVYVALSTGSSFGPSGVQWQEFFCLNNEICDIGDFNGDGKDDIVAFVRDTQTSGQRGDVYVARSTGSTFGPSGVQWHEAFCLGNEMCRVGDFNGDGRDDIAAFVRDGTSGDARGNVYIALSTGSGFDVGILWHDLFCLSDEICTVGDFNGDGKDDIGSFVRSTGAVYVALSTGSDFGQSSLWQGQLCFGQAVCDTGDFNGDGRDDAIAFVRDSRSEEAHGDVYVGLSTTADYQPHAIYLPLIRR